MKNLTGTKEIIFDKALDLIAKAGFDNVSIRDIAREVGIRGSSIYNHYESKNSVLLHFYEYYEKYCFENDISKEEMLNIIETGTVEDIVQALTRASFINYEPKKAARLMLITKVVYTRMFSDEKAAALYNSNFEGRLNFHKEALEHGIQIGRFKPFDAESYAYSFIALYVHMGTMSFANPNYEPIEQEREKKIIQWIQDILSLLEMPSWSPPKLKTVQ